MTPPQQVLRHLDVDLSGSVSWEEFKVVMSDPKVSSILEVMGLDIKEADLLFDMLRTTGDKDEVDFDFLVDACMRMKVAACVARDEILSRSPS